MQGVGVTTRRLRPPARIVTYVVVRDDVGQALEPELRERRQHDPLAGDRPIQHHVERRDAVRRHHQQVLAEVVHFADLAPRQSGRSGRSSAEIGGGRFGAVEERVSFQNGLPNRTL
jgi:hypothetical protein